jgi:hypothetical protein
MQPRLICLHPSIHTNMPYLAEQDCPSLWTLVEASNHGVEIPVQVSSICKDRRERALNKTGSCTEGLLVVSALTPIDFGSPTS